MADIDGDGRLDLVTGSDDYCDAKPGFHWFRRGADERFTAQGEILVRVAGIQTEPISTGAGNLEDIIQPLDRFRMMVRLADWDGDGRLDLITATFATPGVQWPRPCRIWWQRNEGTPDAPRLGRRRLLIPALCWPIRR